MPRLTRAESQARTRRDLIAAARTVFLTEGYQPTTIDAVSEAAGFSRGAVYSNFGGKERLCLAVLRDLLDEEVSALHATMDASASVEYLLAELHAWAERKVGEPGWTLLTLDFVGQAHRDPHLAGEFDTLLATVRTRLAAGIEDLTARLALSPAVPGEQIGEVLLALIIGLGVQRVLDPRITVTTLSATLRALLSPREPASPELTS